MQDSVRNDCKGNHKKMAKNSVAESLLLIFYCLLFFAECKLKVLILYMKTNMLKTV